MAAKQTVFLSYSREDKKFLDELLVHLKVLQQYSDFEIWDDTRIKGGENWNEEIVNSISGASLAILLISPDYLASDWIHGHELPYLLKQKKTRDLRIFPIILRPSPWKETPLAYHQLWPSDGSALSSYSKSDRDRLLSDLVKQVHGVLRRNEDLAFEAEEIEKKEKNERLSNSSSDTTEISFPKGKAIPSFFLSHSQDDGDFAENLKFRLDKEGFRGWIDVDILEAGVDWRQEIDDAILNSQAVILVLSPNSKSSEYVTYEWAFALGSGIRIVPLMLNATPIHPRLEVFQYLDFTNRRARPWNRLISLLKELVVSETSHHKK
jgi:hypothetical protein